MSYLQQKDSTWQTRRSSSSFTRYTRSHRRQLFLVFACLCMLVYWTVCVGLDTSQDLFTPPLPASPNFFAGGSEDRLVTVQPHKASFTTVKDDQDKRSQKPVELMGVTEERTPENRPATVQVIKGSSVHDIGDIEEQQSLVKDALELQPVVADGGRLTDISKIQASDRLGHSEGSAFGGNTLSKSVPRPLGGDMGYEASSESQLVKSLTSASSYAFPDTSNFERLNRLADELPDFVHIPLRMAVKDEILESWEEDWFAHADYDAAKHGKLHEPKIDFVYTCRFFFPKAIRKARAHICRGQRFRREVCAHNATL
jgi:hypothetical protein